MKYDQTKILDDERFRRLTGIKRAYFWENVFILPEEDKKKKAKGGRNKKLSIEDQLLMSLEYLREYRTYFYVGQNYGVSESLPIWLYTLKSQKSCG